MRNLFAGLMVVGLFCGVTLAQNAPRENQGTQPGATGQPRPAVQPAQPGQLQPARPGQVQPRQPGQGQLGQQGQSGSADQQIAACVFSGCHNHIEIAKFAQSKAQSEEVRDFAEKMVSDHSPGCEELKQLAGQLAADHGGQAHATQPRAGGAAAGGNLDWVSIKKEIAQQCLKSTKEELSSKQGPEFDKCYIGYEINAHMKVVDELTVLKNHASSELKQKLEKSLQMAQQHLQLAKQIDQKLKDRPSERVSRRPEGNK